MFSSFALKRFRIDALGAVLLAAVLVLFVAGCSQGSGDWRGRVLPDRIALRSLLEAPDQAMLRQVYATRGFKPIWLGGETRMSGARQLVWLLDTSDGEGLAPARYGPRVLGKRLDRAWWSTPRERARTELLLTAAYIEYVHDLHTPAAEDDLAYTDRDLQPSLRDRTQIARQLAGNAWPQPAIKDATQMNGLYVQMRDALDNLRSVGPRTDAAERRLLMNLDRLRALPSKLGDRFVLVDVAANRLWLYEDNKPVDSMKVVVGAPNGQTPQMAALIRYAIYNPFWNVPPDLTRDNYAPRIAANLSALSDLRMDAWSSFTAGAQILSPRAVNWNAVARGQELAWLRQRPGPANSMGAAKFMLPNELGIYLHDTPNRELFDKDARFFSAGCIRVEDYRRLSRWLFRGAEITAQGAAAEQRFDLPAPVPVYIVYLTARVENGVVKEQADAYGRDVRPAVPTPAPVRAAAPVAQAPAPAAVAPKAPTPVPPTATFERSPGAARGDAMPAPPPPPAPVPKVQPAQPAPAAQRPAPAIARPAPPPRSTPVPVPVPKVQPAPPATVAQRPASAIARPSPPPRTTPVPAPVPKVQPARPAAAPAPPAAAAVAQRPAPASPPTGAGGACRIQAGVFGQRANADNLAKAMKPLGDVRLTEVNSNGAVRYSVTLAGLASRKDAESALSKLNSLTGGKLGARIAGCGAAPG